MKKMYSAPTSQPIMVAVEGMLAASAPLGAHEEYSEANQLSNKNTGWDSSLWANEED